MFLFWWTEIRQFWVPSVDEFPLIVNSAVMYHPHPLTWFTRGYSDYFIVYPQLTDGQTNFLRPVGNLFYFLNSLILGQHWSCYLLSSYFIFAALAAGIVWIAVRDFKFSHAQAALLGLLVFLSPAQDGFTHFYPDACLDLLAAALLVWALKALLNQKLMVSFLLVSVAVFTKETAHFAPFAISLCLYLFSPRPLSAKVKAYICLFPIPVFLLYGLRRLDFHSSGGVYATVGLSIQKIVKSIPRWPFHIFRYDGAPYPPGHLITFEKIGLAACSGIFWVLLLSSVIISIRRARRNGSDAWDHAGTKDIAVATTLIFLVGSLGLPTLLNLPARFGALVFPLVALLGIFFCGSLAASKWQRAAWGIAVVVLITISIQSRMAVYASAAPLRYRWEGDRSYIETVRTAPPGILLIVDDISGAAGVRWLQTFTHFGGEVIPINVTRQLRGYCWQPSTMKFESATQLQIDFPYASDCEEAALAAINKPLPKVWTTKTGEVQITYVSDGKSQLRSARLTLPKGVPVSIMQSDPVTNRYNIVEGAKLPMVSPVALQPVSQPNQ
jgi:hypothetical protein